MQTLMFPQQVLLPISIPHPSILKTIKYLFLKCLFNMSLEG